jgi:hypothetical protein
MGSHHSRSAARPGWPARQRVDPAQSNPLHKSELAVGYGIGLDLGLELHLRVVEVQFSPLSHRDLSLTRWVMLIIVKHLCNIVAVTQISG